MRTVQSSQVYSIGSEGHIIPGKPIALTRGPYNSYVVHHEQGTGEPGWRVWLIMGYLEVPMGAQHIDTIALTEDGTGASVIHLYGSPA